MKLESLGYKSWYTIMNGKDYEIPQNRERCFMVSALGDYYYDFPNPKPLKLRLKDMLESEVDEKYYLSDATIERIKNWNSQQDPLKNIDKEKLISPCITARGAGEEHSGMILIKCEQVGEIQGSGGQEIKIAEDEPRFYDYYNKTEISGEYCGTLTTGTAHNGSGTFLVATKENADLLLTIFDLCGIIKEQEENQYETSRNLLSILWKEIGKKEVQRSIRRFWSLQKKEVLQPRVYENGNVENRGLQSEISPSSSNRGEYYEKLQMRKKMLNMWEIWKVRYTPQRWELSKQQFDEFNIFMSQLSYETTSEEESMQNLRTTDESIRILQQTLYSLQKIWRPELHKEQNEYRIRKLTPKEAFRLMGVKDDDFERVARNQSNSSLYHLAGDSIITNCLMEIFKEML